MSQTPSSFERTKNALTGSKNCTHSTVSNLIAALELLIMWALTV